MLACTEDAAPAKRFTSLVKRVLKTPKSEVDRRAKEWKAAKTTKVHTG
jgi:hypothetical protein